ncbi:MAG: outer membrane beta-barrel protein [Gammaproteobacteria bacterium]|nr:outer membrane beta-barrel protein [Gammaproteobacteria bacterium]
MLRNNFLASTFALIISPVIFAQGNSVVDFRPGVYIGAQGGLAWTNEGDGPSDFVDHIYDITHTPHSKNTDKGSWGGRLLIGYAFNPYFALDGGFTLYPNNKYTANGLNQAEEHTYKFKTSFYGIDLMAKGILPLEILSPNFCGWSIYAKLGIVAARSSFETEMDGVAFNPTSEHSTINNTALRPGYSLGIGYNFTDDFGVDLSWSGVYGINKIGMTCDTNGVCGTTITAGGNKQTTPYASLLALGISYKF